MGESKLKKVLVLGSGGLKIGQAGEFDYSGSQALKVLKEEGIKSVLVNPNIATVQTSSGMADVLYLQPVDAGTVLKVIEKERPDGVFLSFGGQTALNTGLELHDSGVFEKYGVEVLGTPVETIKNTEDRERFVRELDVIAVKTAKAAACLEVKQAVLAAEELGYPVMVRSGYSLGGLGSGVAWNAQQLKTRAEEALRLAPQILVEEYLEGWKEVEYEVVRDGFDSCITVCNMENLDPMGIHTGESIVVAPSQTLSNNEYHMLREIAIRTVRHLGIVGECNIQYALCPETGDYRVIEVNARLSRSSALASKATGYPLASVAARLALGMPLSKIRNTVTGCTSAFFEPAMDYIVVKVPRWDLERFHGIDSRIGSQMKSVGEVMAIGRGFEEALQKALRMIGTGMHGLVMNSLEFTDLEEELKQPTHRRIFAVVEAFAQGISVDRIHELTRIDRWFLFRIKEVVNTVNQMKMRDINSISAAELIHAKRMGFSDYQIAKAIDAHWSSVRSLRLQNGIKPCVKQIDTLAAEFPAVSNYLYTTYWGEANDVEPVAGAVVVLGSGPYRIGSSVEFDWCCVNTVETARKMGYLTVMINCNPETVSTDFDTCDRLYFDELTLERVLDIYEFELPEGVIVSMGGQIANNLVPRLHSQGVKILGTSADSIDRAEDRHKFSSLLDELGIDQPEWSEVGHLKEASEFASKVGYPVMLRPSYVLSGASMAVVWDDRSMSAYLSRATEVNPSCPVVVSKFIQQAKEIEFDGVARNGEIMLYALGEHVENAGIHSGDATVVIPPQRLFVETVRRVRQTAGKIVKALEITGPFNIQFLARDNRIRVIECNLRASRTFPLSSKVLGINFIDLATRAILGEKIEPVTRSSIDLDHVGVKAAQFSFQRLTGVDPVMGVAMASTGEVGCIGESMEEALFSAMRSVGFIISKKTALLSTGPLEQKALWLPVIYIMRDMGFSFYATPGTARFLRTNGITVETLRWPMEEGHPGSIEFIREGKIGVVINLPKNNQPDELSNDYLIRRAAVDNNIPLLTNLNLTRRYFESMEVLNPEDLPVKSWSV